MRITPTCIAPPWLGSPCPGHPKPRPIPISPEPVFVLPVLPEERK